MKNGTDPHLRNVSDDSGDTHESAVMGAITSFDKHFTGEKQSCKHEKSRKAYEKCTLDTLKSLNMPKASISITKEDMLAAAIRGCADIVAFFLDEYHLSHEQDILREALKQVLNSDIICNIGDSPMDVFCGNHDVLRVLIDRLEQVTMAHVISAAELGLREDFLRKLLEKYDLPSKNKDGKTILHVAVIDDLENLIELILERHAKLELLQAAWRGGYDNWKRITTWLKDTANSQFSDKDDTVKKLLFAAIQGQNYDIVKQLLDERTWIDIQDEDYRTPLFWAVDTGDRKMVDLLLDYDSSTELLEHKDKYGFNPLLLAAYKCDCGMVKLLLEKKVNVNVLHNCGYSAAILAIGIWSRWHGLPEHIVEKHEKHAWCILRLLHADTSFKHMASEDNHCLGLAVCKEQEEIVKFLVDECGVAPDDKDEKMDMTSLDWVLDNHTHCQMYKCRHLSILWYLLEKGAQPTIRTILDADKWFRGEQALSGILDKMLDIFESRNKDGEAILDQLEPSEELRFKQLLFDRVKHPKNNSGFSNPQCVIS
ncbi:ankyrin repeat-containing domain protein [Aspergillus flavus]|uniref:Ankyrin repeat-containing domain protein n=1 Tax=Aspergillus flavus TaxID=5059 RepID=A0A5N6GFK4_ASPFL|nr:ankyrin repeat-containing domain protein [Aspergillus flavus]